MKVEEDPKLALFFMYQALSDCEELRKAIADFNLAKKAFFADEEATRAHLDSSRKILQRNVAHSVKLQQLED